MNKNKRENEEFVNPLDFLNFEDNNRPKDSKKVSKGKESRGEFLRKGKAFFITGTDTNVGKTIVTHVLGLLLKEKKYDVGVMKPIQCGGDDAKCLIESLGIKDSLSLVNPYFAREPLSPHIAFKRKREKIDIQKIFESYRILKNKHDILLVEGAGGLMVPISDKYLMADLIRDLNLEIIIVSRLGLGTINHTLLTVQQARNMGIKVKGIIFNETKAQKREIPETTNPQAISLIGKVPILGTVPFLRKADSQNILRQCEPCIDLNVLLVKKEDDRDKQFQAWDKKYLWHPFTQMQDWLKGEQLIIDEANGCYLTDCQGRKYLDGISSLWVNVHGHRHKGIDQAIKNQINKLSHSTLLGLSNTPATKLAKKLIDIAPQGLEKVFYSDNGSTAVEVALKMAYQYWQNTGKKKKAGIVHLSNSYHGDTLGSVSVGGIDLFHKVYRDLIFKTIKVDFPDCYRAPQRKGYPAYAFECVNKMEKMFARSHDTIAALVIEPIVQGAAGMIVWPEGILKRMADICRKYNVLLILDEVATGFGRTGKMFACQHERVSPDFLCLAKGLTGGYLPLAATLTTKRVFNGFLFPYKDQKTFFHGHTYTGNPLCCVAALANLKVFEKENVLQNLQPKLKYLDEKLKNFYKLEHVGQVRNKGFMIGIELVKDKKNKTPYPWEEKMGVKVCEEIRKRGVILRPLGNVIVIIPPLSITIKELGYILKVTYETIQKLTSSPSKRRSNIKRIKRGHVRPVKKQILRK